MTKTPKKSSITDETLLTLIRAGWIVYKNGNVLKYHARKKNFYPVTATVHPSNGRYRYNIRIGKSQRTIQRNRLHWMITHQQPIPNGVDVDHMDRNKQNDDPANLRLRGIPDNRGDNWSNSAFAEVANFFDSISGGF